MAIGGTQVDVGIGIEGTPGTPVAAAYFPKWASLSMQAVAEKAHFESQRGVRNASSDSMIRRRFSQGDLEVVANVKIAPVLYYLALGSLSTASNTPETGSHTHTITVQNANASMKAATVIVKEGGLQVERYSNVVVNTLNLQVSDGYARLRAGLIGGFPDGGSLTASFSQETEFAYHQMQARLGATLTAAASASPLPLKSFELNINNNVIVDEAFLSGANTPVAGGFVAGRMLATGSYSLQFSNTTELAKYKANTKNAAQIDFTGADVVEDAAELIQYKLGRLILTSPPREYNLDGIVVLNQEFQVEFEATDKEVQVVIVNNVASY